ncbi:LCP family protein [Patescibacteria group bacterium]
MNFKTRKIRYRRKSILKNLLAKVGHIFKHNKTIEKAKQKTNFGLVISIIIVFVLFLYGCSAVISRIGLINVIGIFGEPLQTDVYGNTNVLLLGTGGGDHDGADLTDTIILASIDQKNKLVPMLSIPRDFYVNIEELGDGARINRIYELGKHNFDSATGIKLVKEAVEEISGVDIHYYVRIDFQGFKDIVDSLGGVDIYIDEEINDPYYPKEGTIQYETFYLPAGQQELDGDTALKYARSRKTTSDFDRSKRQQKLLFAIKNKAMTKNILLNPGKISDLYGAVNSHIETNLSIRHIIELAKISQDFNQENLVSRVMTDDPTMCGGFLYVPERDLFGGAYVLVPIGNDYSFIHQYVDLIFHYPELNKNPVQIQILNGTKTPGLAGEAKAMLQRLCFDVIRYGNARNQEIDTTNLYFKSQPVGTEEEVPREPKAPDALYFIKQLIPGNITNEIPEIYFESQYVSDANLILELGENYADSKPDDIFYLYYPTDDGADEETTDEEEATTE